MKYDWHLLLAAWLVAMVATLGALFIGEVMLIPPCNLCWYQGILMFPLALILGIASAKTGAVLSMPCHSRWVELNGGVPHSAGWGIHSRRVDPLRAWRLLQ